MKKGIIMEIDEEFLTLMTPEGEFLHTRRQNQPYAIGEEIHFFPIDRVKSSNPFSWFNSIFKFKPVLVLVAVFVILLGSFFPMYQSNKAYAYMSIDVNPSIELGVNKKMQVVEITGFNKDGKKIVSHLTNWKKKNVSDLTQTILAEMNKEGYLSTNDHVIISTARTKSPEENVEKELKANIEEIRASIEKQNAEPTVVNASKEELVEAHKRGITTGKNYYTETKTASKETSDVKTKYKKEQTASKAKQLKPDDSTPSGAIKKRTETKALQNKVFAENKRQSEKKWINGKFTPPGQLKKIDEKQIKQKQERSKKQNNNQKENKEENKKSSNQEKSKGKDSHRDPGKEKKTENKKSSNQEKSKGKDSHRDPGNEKKAENKKSSNQEKSKEKDSYSNPGNNNNENQWKNKEKEIVKHDDKKSKKSSGKHKSNQKDK
ncbi:anti-sigma factor domain-containing protein [Bacillus sp. UNC41MFS5]|uniref:anti-sigma factor domain-containing protein n=1 Tax=Bacillus sp. UNC41MFS5 TaxID=1449046 RepID=UPI00047A44A6|nr:anti-sigma factor domain-containing protein [Bacillus sp. UNC41MFS5]